MSEIPELPPLPRRTRPLPAGGLEAAVAGGRRRRNQFLGAAGGATTAVAAVLALALAGPSTRNDSLMYAEPEQTATASAEPSPTATPDAAQPEASQAPGATPEPTPRTTDGPGRGSGPSGSADREEGDVPDDSDVPVAAGERESYTEEPQEVAAPAACQGTPGQTDAYFSSASSCGNAYSPSSDEVPQGGQVSARIDFCVPYQEDEVVLTYDDGREHEVRVFQGGEGGQQVYTFSDTVAYTTGPHQRVVGTGRCLVWTGVWDTTLTDGSLAPPGTYFVSVSAVPDKANEFEVREGDGGSVGFYVNVTPE